MKNPPEPVHDETLRCSGRGQGDFHVLKEDNIDTYRDPRASADWSFHAIANETSLQRFGWGL